MKMIRQLQWTVIASAAAVWCGAAQADSTEGKFIPKSAEGADDTLGTGWHPALKGAANFALGHSQNTPGTPDGLSLQFGYLIGGKLDYLSPEKRHEWANSLDLELQYAMTPVVEHVLIKSADEIDLRSAYFYHPTKLPWLGPFVSFRLTAPMLSGDAVYAEPQNIIHLAPGETGPTAASGDTVDTNGDPIAAGTAVDSDGNPVDAERSYGSGKQIPLTGAFAPLTLRESLGMFVVPVDKKTVKFDARLGFGAWETFVRDGYFIEDNADTTNILELRQMQDSVQIGPELGMILNGAAKEILTYRFSALFMQPIYQSSDSKLEGIDLMNMEFEAGLGIKITKYMSIDYSFKAYKQPLIIDDWQIQNNLLFSVGFSIPEPPPPPPACPPPPPCPACPKAAPVAAVEPVAPIAPAPAAPAPAAPAPEGGV
jgi:hypothetical protein